MPPVCSRRTLCSVKIFRQSIAPGCQLRHGAVPSVRDAKCRSEAETPFEEVDTVAPRFADAVVRQPANEVCCHSAGCDAIAHQLTDGIIDESGDNGGAMSETSAEATGHIVFAATLPDLKALGLGNAGRAGIKAQHDLA